MIKLTVECNVCNIQRKKVNHWFRVMAQSSQFMCSPLQEEDIKLENASDIHVCGQEHGQILFQRWLATGSIELDQPTKQYPEVSCLEEWDGSRP